MTVRQTAARLEVSATTIYNLIAAGKLRCHRVGLGRGCIRISEEHLADFLRGAQRGVETPSGPAPVRSFRPKHLRPH
jgi:excisionase family DNA binding protein